MGEITNATDATNGCGVVVKWLVPSFYSARDRASRSSNSDRFRRATSGTATSPPVWLDQAQPLVTHSRK
jgi:hypothetical protein